MCTDKRKYDKSVMPYIYTYKKTDKKRIELYSCTIVFKSERIIKLILLRYIRAQHFRNARVNNNNNLNSHAPGDRLPLYIEYLELKTY